MRRFYIDEENNSCLAQAVMFDRNGPVAVCWRRSDVSGLYLFHDGCVETRENLHLLFGWLACCGYRNLSIRWDDFCCRMCGAVERRRGQQACIYCGAAGETVDWPGETAGSWLPLPPNVKASRRAD